MSDLPTGSGEHGATAPPLLLTHALVVSLDPDFQVLADGAVLLEGGRIAAVGASDDLAARTDPSVPRMDVAGAAVMPGLVNTHAHLYANLLKGASPSRHFGTWMADTIGPAADLLDEDDCYWAALAGGLEAVRTGTTTLVEFSSVLPTERSAGRIIEALRRVGLRVVFARGVRDVPGDGFSARGSRPVHEVIAEVDDLRRRYGGGPDPLTTVGYAPTALWAGVSDAGLQELADHARRSGSLLTMHVAEVEADDRVSRARSGRTTVSHLDRLGVLGPHFMAVHGNQMARPDLEILAARGATLSHNPVSNLYFGHRTAPIPAALELGVRVGLGTDSAASNNGLDMFETLKVAALLHGAGTGGAEGISERQVLAMATSEGARIARTADDPTGLVPGSPADVIVLDLDHPKIRPVRDIHRTLALSLGSGSVRTVIVAGAVVVDHGRSTLVDEPSILREAQARSDALAGKLGAR